MQGLESQIYGIFIIFFPSLLPQSFPPQLVAAFSCILIFIFAGCNCWGVIFCASSCYTANRTQWFDRQMDGKLTHLADCDHSYSSVHDVSLPFTSQTYLNQKWHSHDCLWHMWGTCWFLGKILLTRRSINTWYTCWCLMSRLRSWLKENNPGACQVCFWCGSINTFASYAEKFGICHCARAFRSVRSYEKESCLRNAPSVFYLFDDWSHCC